MKILLIIYKIFRKIFRISNSIVSTYYTKFLLKIFNAKFETGLYSNGFPVIDISSSGILKIGNNFKMNNGNHFNRIGRQQKCFLIIGESASLEIGNNVGISSTAIVCNNKIIIADNVKIGGNTVIYDTDFHSLNFEDRMNSEFDKKNTQSKPVIIGKNVFVGAHSTILKGVEIGENAIVAACSVVTKDIGAHEVWGGNPARFIKKI
jgi:acetyltransferase-like isoleucine patch superfamily enzyme